MKAVEEVEEARKGSTNGEGQGLEAEGWAQLCLKRGRMTKV